MAGIIFKRWNMHDLVNITGVMKAKEESKTHPSPCMMETFIT